MKSGGRERRKEKYIKPLSNYDIVDLVAKLKIPHFYGVFMRDTLSKCAKKTRRLKSPSKRECWILNHASSRSNGTHWTALARNGKVAFYFDSFGKLPPPFEVVDYLRKYGDDSADDHIHLYYNVKQYQSYGSNICGHLCLKFLYDFWRGQRRRRRQRRD